MDINSETSAQVISIPDITYDQCIVSVLYTDIN